MLQVLVAPEKKKSQNPKYLQNCQAPPQNKSERKAGVECCDVADRLRRLGSSTATADQYASTDASTSSGTELLSLLKQVEVDALQGKMCVSNLG